MVASGFMWSLVHRFDLPAVLLGATSSKDFSDMEETPPRCLTLPIRLGVEKARACRTVLLPAVLLIPIGVWLPDPFVRARF